MYFLKHILVCRCYYTIADSTVAAVNMSIWHHNWVSCEDKIIILYIYE